jgi:hypothetical protein
MHIPFTFAKCFQSDHFTYYITEGAECGVLKYSSIFHSIARNFCDRHTIS